MSRQPVLSVGITLARGSKGSREHAHADFETARKWSRMDPELSSDLVYIQREDDPFVFVDRDDVRDPEIGEIHPIFEAILEHLGVTYADISTSGAGVHAVYRGEIPLKGVGQATFDIKELIGIVVTDANEPTIVTALPATGKTTGTVKTARERPLSYLAARKELQ